MQMCDMVMSKSHRIKARTTDEVFEGTFLAVFSV